MDRAISHTLIALTGQSSLSMKPPIEYIETVINNGIDNIHAHVSTSSMGFKSNVCPLLIIVIEGLKQNIMKIKTIPSNLNSNISDNSHMMTGGYVYNSLMYNSNISKSNDKGNKQKYYWEMPRLDDASKVSCISRIPCHLRDETILPDEIRSLTHSNSNPSSVCWGVLSCSSPRLEYNMICYCFNELYGDLDVV